MNQKELLTISVGIFLTIVAWMIIDLYHAKTSQSVESAVGPVSVPTYNINTKIFKVLEGKTE